MNRLLPLIVTLTCLTTLGIPVAKADDHDPIVKTLICQQLRLGYTLGQVAAQLHQGDPRWSYSQMLVTVYDQMGYCD